MKTYIITTSLLCLLLISFHGSGQTANSDFSYDLILTPIGNVQNMYDTVYAATVEVQFENISIAKKIHIKVKKKDTGTNLIDEVIDLQNTVSASVPVQVDQNVVTMDLGEVINYGLELDIKIQDQNDNVSDSVVKNY